MMRIEYENRYARMKKIRWGYVALLTAVLLSWYPFVSCRKGGSDFSGSISPPPPADSVPPDHSAPPAITGKLVYHRYSEYGEPASMYIYDFQMKKLTTISEHWNLFDPINAHFNPGGTKIVFMAESKRDGKWDIYLWTVGTADQPVNLSAGDGCRDEDPKFSPDGNYICFKQTPAGGNGNIMIMDLNGRITSQVTKNTVESGMPYYSADAGSILYARGAGNTSDIYRVNVNDLIQQPLANESGVQEYYPIGRDTSSFLFSRWYSSSNLNDQVYMGFYSGAPPARLKFNAPDANYSDAFPCGEDDVILSSTRKDSKGGYDLYIADLLTGDIWSLSAYNSSINGSDDELGACYSPN